MFEFKNFPSHFRCHNGFIMHILINNDINMEYNSSSVKSAQNYIELINVHNKDGIHFYKLLKN